MLAVAFSRVRWLVRLFAALHSRNNNCSHSSAHHDISLSSVNHDDIVVCRDRRRGEMGLPCVPCLCYPFAGRVFASAFLPSRAWVRSLPVFPCHTRQYFSCIGSILTVTLWYQVPGICLLHARTAVSIYQFNSFFT